MNKSYVFSDSVLCLGKIHENLLSNGAWEDRLEWFNKSTPEYRKFDRIDGDPMEFEWTLQLCSKVQELLSRLNETPENFTGRTIFMSMFNDISWGSKDNKIECESNAKLVSLFARGFGAGQWSFLGPGSEKKRYSISEDSPQGEWDKMAEKMMVAKGMGSPRHAINRRRRTRDCPKPACVQTPILPGGTCRERRGRGGRGQDESTSCRGTV